MAGVCKSEIEIEVKCAPHKFYETIKYSLHHLPSIFPEGCNHCEILEGDGRKEGDLKRWKYKLPGSDEELTVKARTTKQDDENMIYALFVEEGDLHNHYKHFQVIVQVFPKGEGSLVKWAVEFEKHHGEIPDPHPYFEFYTQLIKKVEEHIHKAEKSVGGCKPEIEIEVKCPPHKFYEMIKYSLHHLPTIFPEVYTGCEILKGDGRKEGDLRHWKYKLPGSDEELTVKARTTKQDDNNMIYALFAEEGDLHNHYRHFKVIVQVFPKGEGSLVKWVVEFEKHHGEIPDPHAYIELFTQLIKKLEKSFGGVCKPEIEIEVKCPPHKFYEMIKYSLHHLPTIFPEVYTGCEILEGDGRKEGDLRHWKYKLPGSDEELTVKARTTKQDDKNMIYALFVEEGDPHNHYRHFKVIVQVFPKGDGSLVKWVVEFEKHHGEIPDPHPYIELLTPLTKKLDDHIHKAEKSVGGG